MKSLLNKINKNIITPKCVFSTTVDLRHRNKKKLRLQINTNKQENGTPQYQASTQSRNFTEATIISCQKILLK